MSALSSIPRRVKIKLKKSISSADATVAQFGECIIQFFGFTEKGYGNVGWRHENDELTLFGLEKGSTCLPHKVVVIKHASLCPMLHLDKSEFENLPAEVKDRGVNIGVAILLTSTDNHVLITRRSGHMRTFPGVWVPPGGHIESGETLFEAGARELREETGLVLESVPHHLLGLWESVYPHKLEMGGPSRQHVVVYLSVKSHLPWRKLADRVKLEPSETDAAMWLPFSLVEKISTGRTGYELPHVVYMTKQESEKPAEDVEIPTATIVENLALPENATATDVERFSWGTRFALQQWTRWISLNNSDSKL